MLLLVWYGVVTNVNIEKGFCLHASLLENTCKLARNFQLQQLLLTYCYFSLKQQI